MIRYSKSSKQKVCLITAIALICVISTLYKVAIDRLSIFQKRSNGFTTNPLEKFCQKPNTAKNYLICTELPFTNTECGQDLNDKDTFESPYLVPNIVHYVWFGDLEFRFYQYLSVRSVAAYQKPAYILFHVNESEPRGEFWQRAKAEIPCIRVIKTRAPECVHGNNISLVLHKTDVARMLILLQHGGIYLDSDVLLLKSLKPLRSFEFTMGRSTKISLSNSVMLSKPNATFLQVWYQQWETFDKKKIAGNHLADYSIKLPYRLHFERPELLVHIEEISIQRPNPWVDGKNCISHDSYNISENYVLHLHPVKSLLKDSRVLMDYREDDLRLYDATYGAAARSALFGTQDLIFLQSEKHKTHDRKVARKIIKHQMMAKYEYEFPT